MESNPRLWRPSRLLLCVLAFGAIIASHLTAQTVEKTVSIAGRYLLKRPVQIAISPSGDAFAISDQQANRILVLDLNGNLLWASDDALTLNQPAGICFESEDAVLFSLRDQLRILRITKSAPMRIDTVKELSDAQKDLKSIDQIISTPKGFLVLDQARGVIAHFTPDWQFDGVTIPQGQGKGALWSPSCMTLDISGNLMVADAGSYPVQCFSSDGRFLYFAGWNTPRTQDVWEASTLFVSLQQSVWAADATGRQWRIFDLAGNQIGETPFPGQMIRPRAAAVAPDGRVAILDEPGQLLIMSLQ